MTQPKYPTPEKAYKNLQFLNSHDARSIRVLCELIEPETRFEEQCVQHTIVFFGSARSVDCDRAPAAIDALKKRLQLTRDEAEIKMLKRRINHVERFSSYYEKAEELAEKMTRWSLTIPEEKDRFYVCSGGGPGMMEAANKGAKLAGGKSIGLGISLPFEQHLNAYCDEELSFEFHYFFMRKYWFLYLAKALVAFPGGFGTMDELFEVLTLIQTRKALKKLPIVLFGSEFWNDIMNFDNFLKWGVISEDDLRLFKIMDDVDEVADYLKYELKSNPLDTSF